MKMQQSNMALKNKYLNRWKGGAWVLLLVGIFSVINIVLYALKSDTYFLFTSYLPYILGIIGVDYLTGWDNTVINTGEGIFLLSISVVIIILYFVCWYFSRKKIGFLIGGLVFFVMDTVLMTYFMVMSPEPEWFVRDCIFHLLIIAELAIGIHAAFKLKKLPDDSLPTPEDGLSGQEQGDVFPQPKEEQPGISDEFKS